MDFRTDFVGGKQSNGEICPKDIDNILLVQASIKPAFMQKGDAA